MTSFLRDKNNFDVAVVNWLSTYMGRKLCLQSESSHLVVHSL